MIRINWLLITDRKPYEVSMGVHNLSSELRVNCWQKYVHTEIELEANQVWFLSPLLFRFWSHIFALRYYDASTYEERWEDLKRRFNSYLFCLRWSTLYFSQHLWTKMSVNDHSYIYSGEGGQNVVFFMLLSIFSWCSIAWLFAGLTHKMENWLVGRLNRTIISRNQMKSDAIIYLCLCSEYIMWWIEQKLYLIGRAVGTKIRMEFQ